MDDLIDSMKSLNNHCPYDEFENLIRYIKQCESANNSNFETIANQMRNVIKFYSEKINFNPEHYIFTDEYKYMFNIRTILDKYWDTVRDHPLNFQLQISYALNFFKSICNYVS